MTEFNSNDSDLSLVTKFDRSDCIYDVFNNRKVVLNSSLEVEWGSSKIEDFEKMVQCNDITDDTMNKTYINMSDFNEDSFTYSFPKDYFDNPHSDVLLHFGESHYFPELTLPVPKLNILLMAVGTRGDIQPFIQIGRRLLSHGHRVRLATHECYRDFVFEIGNDLEFYPLGGDPHKLSEFMVKTHGNIIPSLSDLVNEVPQNLNMLSDIINSCWGACSEADPKDPLHRYFLESTSVKYLYSINFKIFHC